MRTYEFSIDAARSVGENKRFWAACGLDTLYPLLFSEAGDRLLSRMRERGTCRYMRNHHTFSYLDEDGYENCGGNAYSEDSSGNPVYSFGKMNAVFGKYLEYGIKPIVELDYLPDKLARGRGDTSRHGEGGSRRAPTDWGKWRALLEAFTRNLIAEFGADEVRTWYFEVWNEPDDWPFDSWPEFYKMYDVFVDAVTGVDPLLRVGGAGTYKLEFTKGFLEHVCNGTNFVTGARGTRIDFVSHHIYGMSGSWIDEFPLVTPTVQRFVQQLLWLGRIIGSYKELGGAELLIDEWGVVSHYDKSSREYPALALRDSEYSACFFVKLVDCIIKLREAFGIDVGMLLYWGFCAEDDRGYVFHGNRSLSTARGVMKPIQTAHELLASLGDELLYVGGTRSGGEAGCIASRGGQCVSFIAYNFNESDPDGDGEPSKASFLVSGLEDGGYRVGATLLDKRHHNTYRKWRETGSPENPEDPAFGEVRDAAELSPDETFDTTVRGGELTLGRTLPAQSIVLIRIEKL